jgi:hypothetical protein
MKAMIMLTFIIQPWPPQDFGMLVDSLTLAKNDRRTSGIHSDAFAMYSMAIFGKDFDNTTFSPKVAYCKVNCCGSILLNSSLPRLVVRP